MKKKIEEVEYFISTAHDEIKDTGNAWISANQFVIKYLDKNLKEPYKLVLFKNTIMRLTYNGKKFSQGQLVVILSLPDKNRSFADQCVIVKLVPPGKRRVDVENLPNDWPLLHLKHRKTPSHRLNIGNSYYFARRNQFPLNYFLCSTIHKCLGETIPYVATQLSCDGDFNVWDRNQVLVVLSRSHTLSNLIFVGDMHENIAAIKKVLSDVNTVEEQADCIIGKCDVLRENDRFIEHQTSSFLPVEIPSVPCGFVYMIVSPKFREFRINECEDLREDLISVNDMLSSENDRHLQPWILAAFVYGFKGDAKNLSNIDGRNRLRNLWLESIIVLNISTPERALECLQDIYKHALSDELLSDLVVRKVLNFSKVSKPQNFVPLEVSSSGGVVECSVDEGAVSILEKVPCTATLEVNDGSNSHIEFPLLEDCRSNSDELLVLNGNYVNSDYIQDCQDFWRWSSIPHMATGYVMSRPQSVRLLQLVIQVAGDGHCLFNAIRESLSAQHKITFPISRLIQLCRIDFEGNLQHYLPAFEHGLVHARQLADEYLVNKNYSNTFADLAPYMLANSLKFNVVILDKSSSNDLLRIQNVLPRDESHQSVYIMKSGEHYSGFRDEIGC